MGRLRSARDHQFLMRCYREVNELFGVINCDLYRYFNASKENLANKDPVWDEPRTTPYYVKFAVPVVWQDYAFHADVSEEGRDMSYTAKCFFSLLHLTEAGIKPDEQGNYVDSGDIVAIHTKPGQRLIVYNILQIHKDGWVNDSDKFAGYDCELKRNLKYVPERLLQNGHYVYG